MKTRDEIIGLISECRFSTRMCFYSLLDQFALVQEGGKVLHIKWPNALSVITIEQWNTAYEVTMSMCQDMLTYYPPNPIYPPGEQN